MFTDGHILSTLCLFFFVFGVTYSDDEHTEDERKSIRVAGIGDVCTLEKVNSNNYSVERELQYPNRVVGIAFLIFLLYLRFY